jgi:hypothetical protein
VRAPRLLHRMATTPWPKAGRLQRVLAHCVESNTEEGTEESIRQLFFWIVCNTLGSLHETANCRLLPRRKLKLRSDTVSSCRFSRDSGNFGTFTATATIGFPSLLSAIVAFCYHAIHKEKQARRSATHTHGNPDGLASGIHRLAIGQPQLCAKRSVAERASGPRKLNVAENRAPAAVLRQDWWSFSM